jgi:hypothetical protein
MPDFTPDDLDISPSEFVDACNRRDITDLIDILIEEGHLPKERTRFSNTHSTPQGGIFNESLDILSENRLQLTLEEEDMINKLAERFKYL